MKLHGARSREPLKLAGRLAFQLYIMHRNHNNGRIEEGGAKRHMKRLKANERNPAPRNARGAEAANSGRRNHEAPSRRYLLILVPINVGDGGHVALLARGNNARNVGSGDAFTMLKSKYGIIITFSSMIAEGVAFSAAVNEQSSWPATSALPATSEH